MARATACDEWIPCAIRYEQSGRKYEDGWSSVTTVRVPIGRPPPKAASMERKPQDVTGCPVIGDK